MGARRRLARGECSSTPPAHSRIPYGETPRTLERIPYARTLEYTRVSDYPFSPYKRVPKGKRCSVSSQGKFRVVRKALHAMERANIAGDNAYSNPGARNWRPQVLVVLKARHTRQFAHMRTPVPPTMRACAHTPRAVPASALKINATDQARASRYHCGRST